MGKTNQNTGCAGFLLGKVLVHFNLIVLKAFSFVHIDFFKRAFQAHTRYGFTAIPENVIGKWPNRP